MFKMSGLTGRIATSAPTAQQSECPTQVMPLRAPSDWSSDHDVPSQWERGVLVRTPSTKVWPTPQQSEAVMQLSRDIEPPSASTTAQCVPSHCSV
jgi:hypothetical protein